MNKKFLTLLEFNEQLLNNVPDSFIRDKIIILILFKTGIRVKELINLKKEDLDLNSNEKIITMNITGKHERTVFIDNETLNLINSMLNIRKKDSDFLFTSRTGKQLSRTDIENIIKKYRTNDNITANTLKQSFINFMLNYNDFTIEEVKQLLGQDYISIEKVNTQKSSKELEKKHENIKWDFKA